MTDDEFQSLMAEVQSQSPPDEFYGWWKQNCPHAVTAEDARVIWDGARDELRAEAVATIARLRSEFVTAEARYAADRIATAIRGTVE